MTIPLKKRSLGELLSLTFQLGFQNFTKLFIIALLFQIPILLVQLQTPSILEGASLETIGYWGYIVMILRFFLGPLQQASMMQIVAEAYTEGKASLGKCLSVGLKRFLPLLVYSLLYGLIIGIGFLLLVIPGLIFLAVFAVGAPALVVEGLGPISALKRSAELTKGFRWQVFGFILVLYVIFIIISGSTRVIGAIMSPMFILSHTGIILNWAVAVLGSIFLLAGPVVLYFQLRIQKENLDLQGLSELVDRIGEKNLPTGVSPEES